MPRALHHPLGCAFCSPSGRSAPCLSLGQSPPGSSEVRSEAATAVGAVERVASSQTRQPAGHQLYMRVLVRLQPRVASRGSEALWCAPTPANALLPRHSLRPAAELLNRVLHSAKALVCAVHSVTASRDSST